MFAALKKLARKPLLAAFAALMILAAVTSPPGSVQQQSAAQNYAVNHTVAEVLAHNLAGNLFDAVTPQKAEAAAVSNYLQNKFIDWFFRAQTFTAPATIYIALATTSSSASACGTEVTGGSYARVAVTSALSAWAGTQSAGSTTASSGTSGQTSNNGAITFPSPTANWGTVTGFCAFDATSGGNLLFFAALTVSKTINNGDAAPSFAAAALTYTITELLKQYWLVNPAVAANDDDFNRLPFLPVRKDEYIDRRSAA